MRFLFKKNYIISFFLIIILVVASTFAKASKIQYSRENISNYFLGIISASQDYNNAAYKHLEKVQSLKDRHTKFNIEFIRTLALLGKFDQAFTFSKSIWNEDEFLFDVDLILGLNFFLKKDYDNAEKYFERLNRISRYNLFFDDFVGNILIAWSKASKGEQDESFRFLNKIPKKYDHIKKIQSSFLNCYFDNDKTQIIFKELSDSKDYNFSRYNFFLANYFLHEKKIMEARKIIELSRKKHGSNLLLRQTENFLLKNKNIKIKNFFSCKNPNDSIAEFFYVLSNLYSSENDYQLSNFYLKISLLLNNKFLPNKALLAENFYYQKKYILSKNAYLSVKPIGSEYSWYAAKSIANILIKTKGNKDSIKYLEKEFNSLSDVNFEHYYELANFYKDNKYYEKSIKYYSLALENLEKDHPLYPKILDRRGSSYERIGEWKKAEKDLTLSLEILPDQPYVLNYLAYSWIDKGINLDKGLKMLKKASSLQVNDGYIIDSLGWAYYTKKNYIEAKELLQRAVELLPSDPIINDHYADSLWMLNKNIQARYIWNYVLNLDETEEELKDKINKKLIFGISKKL